MLQSFKGFVLVLLSALFFSVSGTLQALAPQEATPLVITEVRMIVGGAFLFIWCAASGRLPRSLSGLPYKEIAICALFLLIGQLCFFTGMYYIGVAAGSVISIGSSPIFAAVIGKIFLKRSPHIAWYPATVLALVGITFINGFGLDLDRMKFVGLLMMDGLTYAAYITYSDKLTKTLDPDVAVMMVLITIALLLSPALFFFPCAWTVESWNGILVSLGIGILTAGCAFTFLTAGSRLISPTAAATLCLAEPMAASCWGIFLLKEPATPLILTGIGLTLLSIIILVLGQTFLKRKRSEDVVNEKSEKSTDAAKN